MKLAIIGSRTFEDYPLLARSAGMICDGESNMEIISGGARGADSLGARYAKENGFKLTEFLPDWNKHGKAAGFIRNEDIIKNADFVLAFHDGTSRGTLNSLDHARRLKKPTLIIYF